LYILTLPRLVDYVNDEGVLIDESGLYLGNKWVAANREWLDKNHIECILNVAGCKNPFPDDFEYLT
jgi:hypothetical protein